jgi:hypothetical protein
MVESRFLNNKPFPADDVLGHGHEAYAFAITKQTTRRR